MVSGPFPRLEIFEELKQIEHRVTLIERFQKTILRSLDKLVPRTSRSRHRRRRKRRLFWAKNRG